MKQPVLGVRAHDYPRQPVGALCTAIAADGWRAVQLAFPKAVEGIASLDDITPPVLAATNRALADSGLSVAVLGCYVEPSLADEARRREQVALFKTGIGIAKAVDAGCIGTETTNMAKQPGVSRGEAMVRLKRSLAEILPMAEEWGVTVAVEPVFYHAMSTPELTREVLRDLASPALAVIYDPVNLLAPDNTENQDALWGRAMECFGERIAAVHIKGAYRRDGALRGGPLAGSLLHYDQVFRRLAALPQRPPILREEAVPAEAEADIAFLQDLLARHS